MGCSESKVDDLPLVARCRQRRELIRAAANHRYALAAAHVSYFRSLKDVGDALRKFVDEELVMASPTSSSSLSSPSLTLPPNSKKKKSHGGNAGGGDDESSLHLHDGDEDDDDEESHLHLSDSEEDDENSEVFKHGHGHGSEEDDDDDDGSNHHDHNHHVGKGKKGFSHETRGVHFEEESSSYAAAGFGNYPPFQNPPFPNPYPNPYQYPPQMHHPYGDPYVDQWGPPPPAQPWYPPSNYNMYYMRKSAPVARTVIQEPPVMPAYGYNNSDSWWGSPPGYGGGGGGQGYFLPMSSEDRMVVGKAKEEPPPPPPPPLGEASSWDYFNPFNVVDYAYQSRVSSSPDSSELREREGIPDLEEETESEVYKEELKVERGRRAGIESRKVNGEISPHIRAAPVRKNMHGSSRSGPQRNRDRDGLRSVPLYRGEGSSRKIPVPKSESSPPESWSSDEVEKPSMPPQYKNESGNAPMASQSPHGKGPSFVDHFPNEEASSSINFTDEKSSSDSAVLKSVDEGSVKKKEVSFEMEDTSKQDAESSTMSSLTVLSPNGTRDLQEVVAEIKDEFETASSYGKEVAMLLEVGKLPYQPSLIKVIVSRILYLVSPSMSLSQLDPPSAKSAKLASSTMKMAKSYFDDIGNDVDSKACNLSATLDTLYAWEKKLYREVKEEERIRVLYEKQCKKLTDLDQSGAEPGKIDATRATIRKLLTKLDVSIKAIDSISSRIHKLRDEELQPQVAALIHGLIRMWKSMLKCHRKQFQAIMESKMRKLRANSGLQGDSNLRASAHLERELRAWCDRFNDWVAFQKAYVGTLNAWLLQCLEYEPEQTPDGPVPYSPGRLGAPPIFVICNDWQQAMEAVSKVRVANAMNTFATSLQQLWEKQDEARQQMLRAEYLSKDIDKHLKGKSDKTGLSMVASSESGVSPLDDLKVDLDTMKHKLSEERMKHKDAMKLVHDAASSSLQGGLIPIFKALENFTSEALKAHEHVRLEPTQGN